MSGLIYALCYKDETDTEQIFYIGRTRKTLAERHTEHRKGALNPRYAKPAYEFMRHQDIIETFYITEICKEGELTEAEAVTAAILEGHLVTNASGGDSVVPKERSPSTFGKLNRDAMKRTEPSERRNRLHSTSQNLSKPEIVRSRVLGEIPSAEEINVMKWQPAFIEQLPMRKRPKDPESVTVELCKVGDYLIYVGFRKHQSIEWVFNTLTQHGDGTHASFVKATGQTRLDVLKQLEARWHRIVWYPKFSGDL